MNCFYLSHPGVRVICTQAVLCLRLESLSIGTVDVLHLIFLCIGDRPVHYKMFNNTPGHDPLDTRAISVNGYNQQCLQTSPNEL